MLLLLLEYFPALSQMRERKKQIVFHRSDLLVINSKRCCRLCPVSSSTPSTESTEHTVHSACVCVHERQFIYLSAFAHKCSSYLKCFSLFIATPPANGALVDYVLSMPRRQSHVVAQWLEKTQNGNLSNRMVVYISMRGDKWVCISFIAGALSALIQLLFKIKCKMNCIADCVLTDSVHLWRSKNAINVCRTAWIVQHNKFRIRANWSGILENRMKRIDILNQLLRSMNDVHRTSHKKKNKNKN